MYCNEVNLLEHYKGNIFISYMLLVTINSIIIFAICDFIDIYGMLPNKVSYKVHNCKIEFNVIHIIAIKY